jgi:hypothetical protein
VLLLFAAGRLLALQPSATLGFGTFVQGVSPVYNTISFADAPYKRARFEVIGSDIPIAPVDTVISQVFPVAARFDMGHLLPGAYIHVSFFSAQGGLADSMNIPISVIAAPRWLRSSLISNVQVTTDTIGFDAAYMTAPIPSSMRATGRVGARAGALGIDSAGLAFHVTYDYRNRRATVGPVFDQFTTDLFGRVRHDRSTTLKLTVAALDSNFDLSLQGYAMQEFRLVLDYPGLPLRANLFPNLLLDASSVMLGFTSAAARVGGTGGGSAFRRDGQGFNDFSAVLYGAGAERGRIGAAISGMPVSAWIFLDSRVGASERYVEVPAIAHDTAYGGYLNAGGEVQAESLWQYPEGRGSASLPFDGKYGPIRIGGTFSTASVIDSRYGLPHDWPQPSMDAENDHLGALWVETGTSGKLFFATLDPNTKAFGRTHLVVGYGNSISSPNLKMEPDGSALLVWTQNRYDPATTPTGTSVRTLMYGQDILCARYDAATDSISTPHLVPDLITSVNSGRADGAPSVCRLGDDTYMIAWAGSDAGSSDGALWYSLITRSGTTLNPTEPQRIATTPGNFERPVLVSNAANQAMLSVVSTPGAATTDSVAVRTWEWNGSAWSEVEIPVMPNVASAGMQGASAGQYGVMAFTGRHFDAAGAFRPVVVINDWSASKEPFRSLPFEAELDSLTAIGSVTANVQSNGLAVVSFQQFGKGEAGNQGRRIFFSRNLANPSSIWTMSRASNGFSDTSTFVWASASGLIGDRDYYLLTQEYQFPEFEGQPIPTPPDGIRVGVERLGLVLHHTQLAADGTVGVNLPSEADFATRLHGEKISVIPNPAVDQAQILFDLPHAGRVRVDLYDACGDRVMTAADEMMSAGAHRVVVGTHDLAAGVYVVRVEGGGVVASRTVAVLRGE